jgi:deoxycytidylate deaminase
MYLSCGIPCSDCARGIINAGITRIFCERGDVTKGKHWEENYERSWAMLEEAGINVQFYDDEFLSL